MERELKLTSRQKRAIQSEKLLFDAALSLILKKGFHNVHIEEIAKEAGTSVGLFYKYFRSKDEVVVRQYKKIDEAYVKAYENLPPDMSATEKLVNTLRAGFIFSEELGKDFMSILFTNQFGLKGDLQYVMNQDRLINKVVHEIVEEGQKTNEFRTDLYVDTIVSMVFRCYTGSFFEWTLLEESKNLTEDGTRFLRLFLEAAVKLQ